MYIVANLSLGLACLAWLFLVYSTLSARDNRDSGSSRLARNLAVVVLPWAFFMFPPALLAAARGSFSWLARPRWVQFGAAAAALSSVGVMAWLGAVLRPHPAAPRSAILRRSADAAVFALPPLVMALTCVLANRGDSAPAFVRIAFACLHGGVLLAAAGLFLHWLDLEQQRQSARIQKKLEAHTGSDR